MASRPIREVQALNIITQELFDDLGIEKLPYASIASLEDFTPECVYGIFKYSKIL